MADLSRVVRIALGLLVGFAFVTPSVGATLAYAGFGRGIAGALGFLAGAAAFFLVVTRAERVDR